MAERRCETCRWWHPYRGHECGNCHHPLVVEEADADTVVPAGGVAVEHSLTTDARYGCVHHEPPVDPPPDPI